MSAIEHTTASALPVRSGNLVASPCTTRTAPLAAARRSSPADASTPIHDDSLTSRRAGPLPQAMSTTRPVTSRTGSVTHA